MLWELAMDFILYLIIIFLLKLPFRYLQKVVYAFFLYSKKKKNLNNIYKESLVNNQVYLGTVYVWEKLSCF